MLLLLLLLLLLMNGFELVARLTLYKIGINCCYYYNYLLLLLKESANPFELLAWGVLS